MKSKSHTKRIRGCLLCRACQSVIAKLEHSLYGVWWPRHVLAWQRTGAEFHPSHWVYHSLHYLSRATQKRVREFLESGTQKTHKNTLPAGRGEKTLQQLWQLLWFDLGCRLFKRSRKTSALSLARICFAIPTPTLRLWIWGSSTHVATVRGHEHWCPCR